MENRWDTYFNNWKSLPMIANPVQKNLDYQVLPTFKNQTPLSSVDYINRPAVIAQNLPNPQNAVQCVVKLQNLDLWQQFNKYDTEMVITKTGRRMFPSLRIALSEMDPALSYCVMVEMALTSNCRYKFNGKSWISSGAAEPQSFQRFYLHPDSPATGSHWMEQPITFNKIKLTNNQLDKYGHIVLTSMHQYMPRIHIIQTSNMHQDLSLCPRLIVPLVETKFIAVTAYQNENITKLKIDNNPFAKGFRDTGLAKTKRKANSNSSSPHSTESDNDEHSSLKRSTPSSISGISTLSDDYLDVTDDHPVSPELTSPRIPQPPVPNKPEIPYLYQYPQTNLVISPYYYPMQYNGCRYVNPVDAPQDLSVKRGELNKKKDFSIQSILSR